MYKPHWNGRVPAAQNGCSCAGIAAANYIENMGRNMRMRGGINKDLQESDYVNCVGSGRINNW